MSDNKENMWVIYKARIIKINIETGEHAIISFNILSENKVIMQDDERKEYLCLVSENNNTVGKYVEVEELKIRVETKDFGYLNFLYELYKNQEESEITVEEKEDQEEKEGKKSNNKYILKKIIISRE